jgi:photosystem II stability/assembly factor-like uncharacterized protein
VYSQWIPQSVPVYQPIIGIEFVDENTGWAITYNSSLTDTAYIIATTNGGTDWFIQFHGNVGLQSLDAVSQNICYAGGVDVNGDALFIETSNGGSNWILNNIGANKVPDDMFFLNKDTGYICDIFSGGLYLTTDGGTTWLNRQNGINANPKTLFFLNYDTGFCGGGFSLFKTTNAGMNWFSIFNLGAVQDVFFESNDIGWLGLSNNRVGITTNGGFSWSFSNPDTINGGPILKIFFINDTLGWAGSQYVGSIYRSINKGKNWETQKNPSGSKTISFINSETGWSGNSGLSKTTNGGLTFISGINSEVPNSFKLYQNYPNPFNPSTNIRFAITKYSDVRISIFDLLGREIFNWNSNESLKPGIYEYLFTGENLSSGVYIYRLTAKSSEGSQVYSDSMKMIFLK